MKFLCDEMLAGLGRWLRIAGHDTAIIEDRLEDRAILQKALAEHRILLTRDRHFLEMDAAENSVVFLESNLIDECVQELNQKLNIDWLYAPFTRCLLCNSPLEETQNPTHLQTIPPGVRSMTGKFWYCPECHQVYWRGSHTDRMLKQLHQWQEKR